MLKEPWFIMSFIVKKDSIDWLNFIMPCNLVVVEKRMQGENEPRNVGWFYFLYELSLHRTLIIDSKWM